MDANGYWQTVSPYFETIEGFTEIYLKDFAARFDKQNPIKDMEELLFIIERLRLATKAIAEPIIKFSENPSGTPTTIN